MHTYLTDRIGQVKVSLIVAAVVIAALSLLASHFIVRDLATEERKRMEIWAEAIRSLATSSDDADLSLVLKVLETNTTIPVIVTDAHGAVQTYRNVSIKAHDDADSVRLVKQRAQRP